MAGVCCVVAGGCGRLWRPRGFRDSAAGGGGSGSVCSYSGMRPVASGHMLSEELSGEILFCSGKLINIEYKLIRKEYLWLLVWSVASCMG